MPTSRNNQHTTPLTARSSVTCAAVLLLLTLAATNSAAQDRTTAHALAPATLSGTSTTNQTSRIRRVVREFDFNERPLGNFEETPMHWERLTGPGLPAFARGRIDDEHGRTQAPAFRFTLAGVGSNIAYEYRGDDILVTPEYDCQVVGYVRAEGLQHARAFIAAYLVDRFGERVAGSERVSNLVRTPDGAAASDWQRVEVALDGEFPAAAALRLQLWVLQSYAWRGGGEPPLGTIVREDVRATIWFDDITVARVPRARLRLTNPAGLIGPSRTEQFEFRVSNGARDPLDVELTIFDESGAEAHQARQPVASAAAEATRFDAPRLAAGLYTARARLLSGDECLLERRMRLAALAELRTRSAKASDFGLDLGRWRTADVAGVQAALQALQVRAVRVGVQMESGGSEPEQAEFLLNLSKLLRTLAVDRVESTGVILPREDTAGGIKHSLRATVAGDALWREHLGPLAAQVGGTVTAWQLGDEMTELQGSNTWSKSAADEMRAYLARFVSTPELIVPSTVLAATEGGSGAIQALYVPPTLPTRSLPWQLQALTERGNGPRWLRLDPADTPQASPEDRLADYIRRIVLTKALDPERIYLPAPFELADDGGTPTWQPTELFVVLRTLLAYLGGSQPASAFALPNDSVALVFRDAPGSDSGFVVLWTWQRRSNEPAADLYLGGQPELVDLWGRRTKLDARDGRALVPISSMPRIVDGVQVPMTLVQASFDLSPTYVEPHKPDPKPVLSFRNYFDRPISGTIEITPPSSWRVAPRSIDVTLAPDERFEQPLDLGVPPRQVATTQNLGVRVDVTSPEKASFRFDVPVTIGLRDVVVEAVADWDGDTLIIEQSLRNLTNAEVSFSAYCEAPGRPRIERAFLKVAAGHSQAEKYVFSNARELAGTRIRSGVTEIRGPRTMDQLVRVPN